MPFSGNASFLGKACPAHFVPDLSEVSDDSISLPVAIFQALTTVVPVMLCGMLNILLICLLLGYGKYCSRFCALSLQLVLLDALQAFAGHASRFSAVLFATWVLGDVTCVVAGFVFAACIVARGFLISVLALDHFLIVMFPHLYLKRCGARMLVLLSVVSWVSAVLFQVPGLPSLLNCYGYVSGMQLCTFFPACSQSCTTVASLLVSVVYGPAIVAAPLLLSALAYWKVKRISGDTPDSLSSVEEPVVVEARKKSSIVFAFVMVSVLSFTLSYICLAISTATHWHVLSEAWLVILSLLFTLSCNYMIANPLLSMQALDVFRAVREEFFGRGFRGDFMVLVQLRSRQQGEGQEEEEEEELSGEDLNQDPNQALFQDVF